MFSNIIQFLKIVASSVEDRRFRAISYTSYALPINSIPFEYVSRLSEAEIVITDIDTLSTEEFFSKLFDGAKNLLSIIVIDAISRISKRPELIRELTSYGFTKALLPIDSGAILFVKKGFDYGFFRKTIDVYRESFIYGPNPIHYNTAYTLYNLAKLVLTKRQGTIVEIGTGRGFSTLWLAHVAKEQNSKVISIDNKCDRVDYAVKVLKELSLDSYTELLCLDAKEYDHGKKDIVFVFIDGKKDEYHRYLEAIEKYLVRNALVLAHNTLSDAHVVKPYIEKVYNPPYESITIAIDPAGITISLYA